jgi:hypothetical protein
VIYTYRQLLISTKQEKLMQALDICGWRVFL